MTNDVAKLYQKLHPGQMVWVQIGPHLQQQRLGFITAVGWDSVDVIYFPPAPQPPVVRLSGVWLLNDPRIEKMAEGGMMMGDRGFCQPAADWLNPMNVAQRLEALEKVTFRKSEHTKAS